MRIRHLFAIAAAAAALSAPTLSTAGASFHELGGEVGVVHFPGHVQGTKSRAEVRAELEEARKAGTLRLAQIGLPFPVANQGPGKTRAEVVEELRSEPAASRSARRAQQGA